MYADRPRSTWRIDDRQLAMASDPLDVASLLAAAGDETWTGVPRGTTIGHVHLYVRDIDQAAAFYHDGLGLRQDRVELSGRAVHVSGGYHHHLGTNTWAARRRGWPPTTTRQMLEWELLSADASSVSAAAESLAERGFAVERSGADAIARDPWGIQLRIVAGG